MHRFDLESLSYDPLHGYIPFVARPLRSTGEATEREVIDHPWVQRLRHIHQLQTAWYVFPTAEHSRFQHVLGAMHLASRVVGHLYPSLRSVCPDAPSRGYVETLMRMAALLHDVGHGPFGHFLDDHLLSHHGLTHETLGQEIIRRELADLLRGLRRNPNSALEEHEQLDPEHVVYLIARPRGQEPEVPRWLQMLRSLFCGIYTVDNMDFVLRDAYMTGYSHRAFDLERLLHYSFFSEQGLTIHSRGLSALVHFIEMRAELFRAVYFHRTVRSLDLLLQDLFAESREHLFPGNPLDHLEEYRRFTEWSLLVEVDRWSRSDDAEKRRLGQAWQQFLQRRVVWKMACQREVPFGSEDAETLSLLTEPELIERRLRELLPQSLRDEPLRVDVARYVHRPGTQGPAAGQNFLYDEASGQVRPLEASALYRRLPLAYRICRVYVRRPEIGAQVAQALDRLLGGQGPDMLTNM